MRRAGKKEKNFPVVFFLTFSSFSFGHNDIFVEIQNRFRFFSRLTNN